MSAKSPFKNSHDQTVKLHDGAALRVQVKRLVHVPRMSRETTCFTADLWLDGVKIAELKNNGCGEGSHASPYTGGAKALARFERFVSTLPDITIPSHCADAPPLVVPSDMEQWIDAVIEDMLADANARKLCRQGIVFLAHPDDNSLHLLKTAYTAERAAKLRENFPECVIYNEYPPVAKAGK